MLRLKSVNFGQQEFQHHQLEKIRDRAPEWLIGRSSVCDLVLPGPEVSRVHGKILYCDDTYCFVDEGSTSGSLLNGDSVVANERRVLRSGDLLQLGETFLFIEELNPPTEQATGAAIAYPSMSAVPDVWPQGDLMVRCCRIVDETADVKTFYFAAESPVLFHYNPGQFVNLEVEINGKAVIRSYSISSSPTRPYNLSITVKRVASPAEEPEAPPGLMSNWLHDYLKVGDSVKFLGGPVGHFSCLPDLPSKMLLISAGSGITPMMSMTRWVQDAFAKTDIVFLHSARTPEDIIFRSELETLATQLDNFRLAVSITQSARQSPWLGLTGRISQAMLELVAPDFRDRAVYVCGPEAFMLSVKSTLEAMSFPMQNYQEESFGAPKKKTTGQATQSDFLQLERSLNANPGNGNGISNGASVLASAQSAQWLDLPPTTIPVMPASGVLFTESGQHVQADGSLSILELAEQEGVDIRSACRSGVCGACKIRSRQGRVRYENPPTALTPADQQAGYVLACVAHPVDDVVVEA